MLAADLANANVAKGSEMAETLAIGYSSTLQELSNEYQHDRVKMNDNFCILVL